MEKEIESWLPVVGFEGLYEISSLGRVRSLINYARHKPGRIMDQRPHRLGYLQIKLTKGAVRKDFYVHRLVAMAFIANPKKLPFVNHKLGNKKDNRVSQLEWTDASGNQKHAHATGLVVAKKGEKSPVSKITNKQAISIFNDNRSTYQLGRLYGISQQAVSSIKTGRKWSDVTGKIHKSKIL